MSKAKETVPATGIPVTLTRRKLPGEDNSLTAREMFIAGGKAERERVLKHLALEKLNWGLGTPERRGLERFETQLKDETLPYREPDDGGLYKARVRE